MVFNGVFITELVFFFALSGLLVPWSGVVVSGVVTIKLIFVGTFGLSRDIGPKIFPVSDSWGYRHQSTRNLEVKRSTDLEWEDET